MSSKKLNNALIIRVLVEIIAGYSKAIAPIFRKENKPLPINTAKRMRMLSCALVYLIIPAYVFTLKKTIKLIMLITKILRL